MICAKKKLPTKVVHTRRKTRRGLRKKYLEGCLLPSLPPPLQMWRCRAYGGSLVQWGAEKAFAPAPKSQLGIHPPLNRSGSIPATHSVAMHAAEKLRGKCRKFVDKLISGMCTSLLEGALKNYASSIIFSILQHWKFSATFHIFSNKTIKIMIFVIILGTCWFPKFVGPKNKKFGRAPAISQMVTRQGGNTLPFVSICFIFSQFWENLAKLANFGNFLTFFLWVLLGTKIHLENFGPDFPLQIPFQIHADKSGKRKKYGKIVANCSNCGETAQDFGYEENCRY